MVGWWVGGLVGWWVSGDASEARSGGTAQTESGGGGAALYATYHRVERHQASVKVGMMSVKGRISSAKPMAAMLFDWKRALSSPAFISEREEGVMKVDEVGGRVR